MSGRSHALHKARSLTLLAALPKCYIGCTLLASTCMHAMTISVRHHVVQQLNLHRSSQQHLVLHMQGQPQQQKALESEPGFRELPAQTQQRMRDRLTELNNMRPAQRDRLIERNEMMEHLSVPQRQQVRGAMSQLGNLPEDRRRVVARTFRDLRAMPEGERQQYLNSPAIRNQFNDQERGTLNTLMAVEPYLPGKRAGSAPPQ